MLPDGAICEAQRVDVGSYVTPSKESLKTFAQRVRSERHLIKTAQLLQQSIWRGETVEQRIAAELPAEQEAEERMPIAVGENNQGPARIALLNRFDAKRHPAMVTRLVSAADVSSVEADEGIFGVDSDVGRVKEFDDE